MPEKSEVEVRLGDIYGTAGLDRLRKEQREKLLPRLERKRERFAAKLDAIVQEINLIDHAAKVIRSDGITDYQLRKPRSE